MVELQHHLKPSLEATIMPTKIQIRRGTAAQWTSANPVLLSGEQGFETDTKNTKIGDGVTAWNSLGYAFVPISLVSAKGDLIVASAANTVARLGVGANNTLLVADSAAGTGVKWATLTAAQVPTLDSTKVPTVVQNARTANYTLVLADAGKLVEMNVASANTLTIPTNASVAFPIGTKIDVLQTGAGQTTIAGASGVTVNVTPGLKISAQWGAVSLVKRGTDTWVAIGNLSA
jgi:hypothetical protein